MKKTLTKVLIGIGILYIAVAPISYYFGSESEAASFFVISGVLFAIISRLSEIKEISVLGLIKAKLEKKLDEALATIEQVKELAKIMSISSLSNTARLGWMGGMTDDQRFEILNSTKITLQKLNFGKDEIKEITKDFHNCILLNYGNRLLSGGSSQIPDTKAQESQREWEKLRDMNDNGFEPITPEQLSNFFKKYDFLTPENEKRLKGYSHYYKNHEFLDYEDYKNRSKWPRLKPINQST